MEEDAGVLQRGGGPRLSARFNHNQVDHGGAHGTLPRRTPHHPPPQERISTHPYHPPVVVVVASAALSPPPPPVAGKLGSVVWI